MDNIAQLTEPVAELVSRIDQLFQSLDAKLNFKAELIAKEGAEENAGENSARVVDLRGVQCPLNFVKAKLALEKISLGQTLEVLLDAGEPAENVPASFTEQGQEVLGVTKDGQHFCVKVRRVH